jgi:retron-type reverse transcriptase
MLKIASPHICNSLSFICNLSLYSSEFPADWKRAKVTPIYKSGDHCNLENYRPISVLSVVSKILEKCIHNQLYHYLSSHDILTNCQSGFRAKHSTSTALLDFQDYILNNMDNGLATGVIFLDLKKAFDTVNHNILLN